jgi:cytochrome oxidase assembly protein ShyY1
VPDTGDRRADPAALPEGEVAIEGILEPSEPVVELDPGDASAVPAGQVALVAAPLLVQHWPYPLMTGYVLQAAANPGPVGEAAALPPVPPSTGGSGLALQNLSYALQWWLFSAFGIFFWWRVVRDDHRGQLRPAPSGSAPPAADEEPNDPDGEPVPTLDAGERP